MAALPDEPRNSGAPGNDDASASAPAEPREAPIGGWQRTGLIGGGISARLYLAARAGAASVHGQAPDAPAAAGQATMALKLLKQSAATPAGLHALDAERLALARLYHPNIAGLLDFGISADGLPYLVREHITGQPIDQACAGLETDERLALFLQLAGAVAHAHGRLVLLQHRLEPGSVRVTPMPQEETRIGRGKLWGPAATPSRALGQVRLLAFGSGDVPDPAGQRVPQMGPATASPEYLRGEALTTASDIYSLGVLLRLMLAAGPAPGASLPASRREDLRSDTEAIIHKATVPAPEQRYTSVDAMAADVRRCLAGEPVSVQVPTRAYVGGRFLQRHKLPVALAASVAGLVFIGLVATTWQAERASRARDQADERLMAVRGITGDVVLRYGDAVNFLPGKLSSKQGLVTGLEEHLDRLESEAGDDATWLAMLTGARARLARVQANETGTALDQLPQAARNAQRAIALGDKAWPAALHDADFVAAYTLALQVRGETARSAGHAPDGQKDLDEAQRRLDEALSAAPEASRRPLRQQLAALLLAQAQFPDPATGAPLPPDQALRLYDRAEAELRALDGPQASLELIALRGTLHANRAIAYSQLDRLDRAREDADAAVKQRQRALRLEPFNPAWRDALVTAATNEAVILLRLEQPRPALQASELAWTQVQSLARENGPQNPWLTTLARVAQHHGRALVANGRHAEALPVLAHATGLWEATLLRERSPDARRMLAWLAIYQARALHGTGEDEAARSRVQRAIADLRPLAAGARAYDAKLNLGEGCTLMASLAPARGAEPWLKCARDAYAAAGALQPLAGESLRNFKAASL